MVRFGANTGPLTMNGEWWRLFAHMFLHFGVVHIGFNMYVLWNVGQLGERLLGNPGFLVMYLISGVFGGLASLYWNPLVVSAGASGAVFGACGALFGFVVSRRDTIPIGILKNLRGSLMLFFAVNIVFAAVVPGIDQAAHLGGLAAGLACGFVMSQPLYVNRRPLRWPRNLVCLAAACVLAPLAAYCLPPAPTPLNVVALNRAIAEVDRAQHSLKQKLNNHELADTEFEKAMQTQVLEPLRRLRDKSKMLRRQPGANKLLNRLDRYLELKIESTELLVEGVRKWDAEKIKLHEQKDAAAQQVWAN
jgi:membrane associated rhomboid family serine protease